MDTATQTKLTNLWTELDEIKDGNRTLDTVTGPLQGVTDGAYAPDEYYLTDDISLYDALELNPGAKPGEYKDNTLFVSDATIDLYGPAGEIFTNEGNDTVMIVNTSIDADASRLAFSTGSGDDMLFLNKVQLGAQIMTGSGNDSMFIASRNNAANIVTLNAISGGQPVLSFGTGSDLLEISAESTLNGDGGIDFGTIKGTDKNTLTLDGGTLATTGAIDNMNEFIVTDKGGTLSRNLTLSGITDVKVTGDLRADDQRLNHLVAAVGSRVTMVGTATDELTQTKALEQDFDLDSYKKTDVAIQAEAESRVTLQNWILANNTVANAALSGYRASFSIRNSLFDGNRLMADMNGGSVSFNQDLDPDTGWPVDNKLHGNTVIQNHTSRAMKLTNTSVAGGQVVFSQNSVKDIRHSTDYNPEHTVDPIVPVATASASASQVANTSGGVLLLNGGILNLSKTVFSGNSATASAYAHASASAFAKANGAAQASAVATATATVKGGAVFLSGGSITFEDSSFDDNFALAKSEAITTTIATVLDDKGLPTDKGVVGSTRDARADARGGAIYATGATVNLINTDLSSNRAVANPNVKPEEGIAKGGAIYLLGSQLTYKVTSGHNSVVSKNYAYNGGGFLYLEKGAKESGATFTVEANGSLTVGVVAWSHWEEDSITGTGTIVRNGAGNMTIHSAIAGFTGTWTLNGGMTELATRSRDIQLEDWTINADATLKLSANGDSIRLDKDNFVKGTLNTGDGDDWIYLNAKTLTVDGDLSYSDSLTIWNGSLDAANITVDAARGHNLTLNEVTLKQALVGGDQGDQITVRGNTVFEQTISLGGSANSIDIWGVADFRDGIQLSENGNTTLMLERGAALASRTVTILGADPTANADVHLNWSTDSSLDKVRVVVTSNDNAKDVFAIEFYNQEKYFTLNYDSSKYTLRFESQNEDGWKTLGNIPYDLKPTITAITPSTSDPTNQNITITAVYGDDIELVSSLYKIGENGAWLTYDAAIGIVVTENTTVYFKAIDSAGLIGEEQYVVGNIDKVNPTIDPISPNTTAQTNQDVTIFATYADNVTVASAQYSVDDGATWLDYDAALGIVIAENQKVLFKAVDSAGNEFSTEYDVTNIDKVNPTITAITPSTTAQTNQDVTVTAVFGDNVALASSQYKIGTGEWVDYDTTLGVTVTLNDTVYFKAIDTAGNEFTDQITIGNIDKVKPTITAITPSTTVQTNQDLTVTAVFGDNVALASMQYKIGTGEWVDYNAATGITVKLNGTVYFKAIDTAGNEFTDQITIGNIDKVKPTISAITLSTTAQTNQNLTVTAVYADDVELASMQYKIGTGEWLDYNANNGITVTVNGTVYFKAVDTAGNEFTDQVTVGNIDKVKPTITAITPNTTAQTNQDVTITAKYADDVELASMQYKIGTGAWLDYNETTGITVKLNSTVYFKAVDTAGNEFASSYEVANIDKVKPTITAITPNTTAQTNQDVTITAVFGDDVALASAQYKIGTGEWVDYNAATGITVKSNSAVYFKAIDTAGNEFSAEYTVANIDKVKPTITDITVSTENPTNRDVTITATYADDIELASAQYKLGNGEWVDYDAKTGITVKANNTVYFRAIDTAGSIVTKEYQVTNIDKELPKVGLVTASTSAQTNGDVTLTTYFTDNVAVAGAFYQLEGETAWHKYVEGVGVVVDRNMEVSFKVVDTAGNEGFGVYIVKNIDKVVPTITAIAASTTEWTNQNVTVTAVYGDNVGLASMLYRIGENGTWLAYDAQVGISVTQNGTVYLKAIDTAGNETLETFAVGNIDKVAPTIAVTSETKITDTRKAELKVAFTDNVEIATKEYRIGKTGEWISYNDGIIVNRNATVYFRTTDTAGNITETQHTVKQFGKTAKSDFSQDGKGDLLFTGKNGDLVLLSLDGNGVPDYKRHFDPNTAQVAGIGDYKADGVADVLWHCTDGTVGIWNDADPGQWIHLGNADKASTKIVAAADFNNDGTADVLWECAGNVVGYWKGGTSEWTHIGTGGAGWSIAAAGDFDGNGEQDILWKEDNGRGVGLWLNGSDQWTDLGAAGAGEWRIADVGDFDGDGKDSVLWANDRTGEVGLWDVNAKGVAEWTSLGRGSSGWTVVGALDMAGTERMDIVWRDNIGSEYGIWTDGDHTKWQGHLYMSNGYTPNVTIAG